jgi:hypothetical protein
MMALFPLSTYLQSGIAEFKGLVPSLPSILTNAKVRMGAWERPHRQLCGNCLNVLISTFQKQNVLVFYTPLQPLILAQLVHLVCLPIYPRSSHNPDGLIVLIPMEVLERSDYLVRKSWSHKRPLRSMPGVCSCHSGDWDGGLNADSGVHVSLSSQ